MVQASKGVIRVIGMMKGGCMRVISPITVSVMGKRGVGIVVTVVSISVMRVSVIGTVIGRCFSLS